MVKCRVKPDALSWGSDRRTPVISLTEELTLLAVEDDGRGQRLGEAFFEAAPEVPTDRRDLGERSALGVQAFEHLVDPAAALAGLRQLLAPGATLLLRMPVADSHSPNSITRCTLGTRRCSSSMAAAMSGIESE